MKQWVFSLLAMLFVTLAFLAMNPNYQGRPERQPGPVAGVAAQPAAPMVFDLVLQPALSAEYAAGSRRRLRTRIPAPVWRQLYASYNGENTWRGKCARNCI